MVVGRGRRARITEADVESFAACRGRAARAGGRDFHDREGGALLGDEARAGTIDGQDRAVHPPTEALNSPRF